MGKQCSTEARIDFCDKWRASGLTQKAFCIQHNICNKTLSKWLALEKVKFLPVTSHNETVEITLPSGIRIKIAAEKSFFVSLVRGLL